MAIHFAGTSAKGNWDPFVPYKFQLTLNIYRLWNDQARLVRDSYMKKFKSFEEVEEHTRGEGEHRHGRDIELALQIELVKEHGRAIPKFLDLLRRQSCSPEEAGLTFSTVHRAKGREWDAVHILDDFINPGEQEALQALSPAVRTEEFNILYVAITRAKKKLLYSPDFLE
jgi:superfamily I DNA/RNA helicase